MKVYVLTFEHKEENKVIKVFGNVNDAYAFVNGYANDSLFDVIEKDVD